jgi:hypothetical protein
MTTAIGVEPTPTKQAVPDGTFVLADTSWTTDRAAQHLADYCIERQDTLIHVDRYAQSGRAVEARRVTAEDISMLAVFAARPSAVNSANLLAWGSLASWPDATQSMPSVLSTLDEPNDVYWARPEVQVLATLHESLRRGIRTANGIPVRRDGGLVPGQRNRFSSASKLIYCRWPDVVPVMDTRLIAAYGQRATALKGAEALHDTPWVARLWMAVRDDLRAPQTTDRLLTAHAVAQEILAGSTLVEQEDTVARRFEQARQAVARLSLPRLADILAWTPTNA